jgi:hypothetical protein
VLSELERPAEKFDLSMFDEEEEEKPQLASSSKSVIQHPAATRPSPLPPMNKSPLPPTYRSPLPQTNPAPLDSPSNRSPLPLVQPLTPTDPLPVDASPMPPADPLPVDASPMPPADPLPVDASPLPPADPLPVDASPMPPTDPSPSSPMETLPLIDPSPLDSSPSPVVNPSPLPPQNPVRFSVKATRVVDPIPPTTPQEQQSTNTGSRLSIIRGSIIPPQQESLRPQQQFTVVGQIIQTNSISHGVVLPTLQPPPLTAEALAANSVQYEEDPEDELPAPPKPSDIQSSSSTLYAIKTQDTATTARSRDYSLSMPFRSIVETFQTFSEGMTVKLDQMRTEKKKIDEINIRDLYPRMPWHDVHGCITGLPVRDLAAHFIQRWNHHRVSKSAHDSRPLLTDITDNPYFSVCAKCNLKNIFENITKCPTCNYDLGPSRPPSLYPSSTSLSSSSTDTAAAAAPTSSSTSQPSSMKSPKDHVSSWITYDCYFISQLGCRIQGDGPTLVTLILNSETVSKLMEGKLIEQFGESDHLTFLSAQGYRPIIGDVLVSIEDVTVLHLNSIEIQRFIKRQKLKLKRLSDMAACSGTSSTSGGGGGGDTASVSSYRSVMERRIKVSFRRHFVNNVEEIVKHDLKVQEYLQTTATATAGDESKVRVD